MNIKDLTPAERSNYYSTAEFEATYTYSKDDLGVIYSKESSSFRLWAPQADSVAINLYRSGDSSQNDLIRSLPMNSDSNGTWTLTLTGDWNKTYYTYSIYRSDSKIECVDPYAKSVGVNGNRGMILDLLETNPTDWNSDQRITPSSETDAVIYEAHIRDIGSDPNSGIKHIGKFLSLTETGTKNSHGSSTGLDHLLELGITHLQILPFYDYATVDESKLNTPQFNWGYDPKNYNAPEGSYSTDPYHGEVRIKECKQMIKSLHDHGIGVIMDVVYNHTFDTSFCMNQILPGYFHRNKADGSLSNGSGCGNDVASERSMVRKFIVDSIVYWAKEYHLDGFRFDLVGLLDVDTMNAIRNKLDAINPNILVYGEGWHLNTTLTKPNAILATQDHAYQMPRIGFFNDSIRDHVKGSVFELNEKGYVSGTPNLTEEIQKNVLGTQCWATTPGQSINYCSCHDNFTLWDKIQACAKEESVENQIKQNLLAAAIIFTSQGVPFIHAGEELLRSKIDDTGKFIEDSYNSPDSVNKIDWDRKDNYRQVFEYYKGLISFRKAHGALRFKTNEDINKNIAFLKNLDDNVIAYTVNGSFVKGETSEQLLVIYNPNNYSSTITLPKGNWNLYINDTKAGITPIEKNINSYVQVPAISCMVLTKELTKSIDCDTLHITSQEQEKNKHTKKWIIGSAISIIAITITTIYYLITRKRD
ncbi:glycogen debranching enzyme / pullulanase [Lachnospiraceae bacterium KM106-2]|nr:glycogen debranching enzyme / pullulanase [Lachnospiraceae bacterium KM106-2]